MQSALLGRDRFVCRVSVLFVLSVLTRPLCLLWLTRGLTSSGVRIRVFGQIFTQDDCLRFMPPFAPA